MILLISHVYVKKLSYCLMCTWLILRILSCAQLPNLIINCSKLIIKNIRLIWWMCSKLKINTAWHSSVVFVVAFDHSQHINIVFLFLTLNSNLAVGYDRQVIMFWKQKTEKPRYFFLIKSPISFSDLSLHQIQINYEHMAILWTYNELMLQL